MNTSYHNIITKLKTLKVKYIEKLYKFTLTGVI